MPPGRPPSMPWRRARTIAGANLLDQDVFGAVRRRSVGIRCVHALISGRRPVPWARYLRPSHQILKRPLHPAVREKVVHDLGVKVDQNVDVTIGSFFATGDRTE